jgi:hypothetical protein
MVVKLRWKEWAGHVACMEETRMFWKGPLNCTDIEQNMILRWILRKQDVNL